MIVACLVFWIFRRRGERRFVGGIFSAKGALEAYFQQHYQQFLEEPVPALNGLTPRQAARKPELRGCLIAFMKDHLDSVARQNSENGTNVDLDWVLKELGLEELRREKTGGQ